jgi:hypothetical protein
MAEEIKPERRMRRGPVTDEMVNKALEAVLAELAAHRGVDPDAPAGRAHLLASLEDGLRPMTQSAVNAARAAGLTWGQVGDLFGISASAAWGRFREIPLEAVPWPPPLD